MRLGQHAFCLATILPVNLIAQTTHDAAAPKPAPDVLVFTNGDQLTGKLERAVGGSVVFKSDMAGELTIGFDKIRELRSGTMFALLRKGAPLKDAAPQGTVQVVEGNVVITPVAAAPITAKPADVAFLVDQPTYDKAIARKAAVLEGWNGAITAGATIVRSTENNDTYNAAINLVRAIPTVPYLPARNRTAVDFTDTYGKLTQPFIAATATPASVVKTSIYHADAERDEYFSPRVYALGNVDFDHNYSQGLQLQQIYGGGVGWTVSKTAKQELDVKAQVQYEKEEFDTPSSNVNIFGSTFAEMYHRTLPRKLVFTETANYIPGWSDTMAYSANVTAALVMPVFKRLGASVSITDNYLNNPSPGFNRNSFQFTAGVAYALR